MLVMPVSHSTEASIKVTEASEWEARLLSRKVMLPLQREEWQDNNEATPVKGS